MNAQETKVSKFVLGLGELEVLSVLNKPMKIERIVSHLLKKEVVTSKSSAEKTIRTLERKGFVQINQKDIKMTEAGRLLQNALISTKVIKSRGSIEKGEVKEEG